MIAATEAATPAKAARKATGGHRSTCPECGLKFTATHHRQSFCTPAHKAAFQDRDRIRGRQMAQCVLAWRLGRNVKVAKGSTPSAEKALQRAAAADAFNQFCRLADKFNSEDHKAGRPGALATYARQSAMGFRDPLSV